MLPGNIVHPHLGVVVWHRDPEAGRHNDAQVVDTLGTGIVIATGFKHPWTLVLTVRGTLGWAWTTSIDQSVVIP